jgi:excisionase family DNA binding protein
MQQATEHAIDTEAPPHPRELLSIDKISGALGICKSYTYRLISEGELRSVRIGRRTLVSRRSLDEYLDKIGA